MSIRDMKPFGGANSLEGFPSITIMHDATGTPVTSPTAGAADLVIPAGAVRFRVKTTGTVGFEKGGVAQGGVATLADTDGFVEFYVAGCQARSGLYPDTIALSAGAEFMFDCVTPDGGEG